MRVTAPYQYGDTCATSPSSAVSLARALRNTTALLNMDRLLPTRTAQSRDVPVTFTMNFVDVSSDRPIGPRACSFCVEIPISAPNPSCSPSVKRVDALNHDRGSVDRLSEARSNGHGIGHNRLPYDHCSTS